MCQYLLSTFRINECRFCFSLTCTILTSIGLQRKSSIAHKFDLVTEESRKRTFWCTYVMDACLSVMLGRPRLLRDQDIDQPYPRNIEDQDLLSSEDPQNLPLHGKMEAFIAHADLARLLGRNSDLLYPLRPLTEDQLFQRTDEMLQALDGWRDGLPEFLKPRDKTLVGDRTFERQNTVLKFAHAHLRILITRCCLLADFSSAGRNALPVGDDRAIKALRECSNAIRTILDTACELIQSGSHYQAFWFTQYVILVAISTLYVFIIQESQSSILPGSFPDVDIFFCKARYCQQYLASLSPEGSQAHRHFVLLNRLRVRAEKDAIRKDLSGKFGSAPEGSSSSASAQAPTSTALAVAEQFTGLTPTRLVPTEYSGSKAHFQGDQYRTNNKTLSTNPDPMIGPFSSPEDDYVFQTILELGWESLDTVGLPQEDGLHHFQP